MPFTTAGNPIARHEEPLGGGYRGRTKIFHVLLAANTPYPLYFEGHRLKDGDNVHVKFSDVHTNSAGEVCGGVPATTVTIDTSRQFITLTHTAIMRCTVEISGDWERI